MNVTASLKSRAGSRPVRFLIVGGWNTIFGVAFFTVFYLVAGGNLGYAAVLAISQVVAVLQAHATQRFLVWKSRGAYFRELARFSVLYVITYFVNLALLALGVDYLGFRVLPTQWAIAVLLLPPTYAVQRVWAFRAGAARVAGVAATYRSAANVPRTAAPPATTPAPLASPAVIAPFVAEIVGLSRRQRVGYRECAQCGLTFFDFRYSDANVLRDVDGELWLMECNPRFPAWIHGATLAGRNLPANLYASAKASPVALRITNVAASREFTGVVTEIPVLPRMPLPIAPEPHHGQITVTGKYGAGLSSIADLLDESSDKAPESGRRAIPRLPESLTSDLRVQNALTVETPARLFLATEALNSFTTAREHTRIALGDCRTAGSPTA